MTRPGPEFDRLRAEADLTDIVLQEWTAMPRRMRLGGEAWRFATLEEGLEDDPSAIWIVRESDGLRLECQVWVSLWPADPPDVRPAEDVAVTAEAPAGDEAQGKVL